MTVREKTQGTGTDERHAMIVAAIPCYNEERHIASVVIRARKFVDSVLVVDDGSSDESAEVARAAGAIVCQHDKNRGYGAAVRTALAKGQELGADVLVLLDGDGQHDPRDIPGVVKPVVDGRAEVVIGSRFLEREREAPLYRRVGQRVLTLVTNIGAGSSTTDSQSGFRALSATALEAIALSEGGMSVASEMQFALKRSGMRVAEVPIHVSYFGRSKRNPILHGLGVLSRVAVLFSLRSPMLLFGLPGGALLIGGLLMGLRVLSIFAETSKFPVGSAMATTLLVISGLLALFMALILKAMKELMRGSAAQLAREVRVATKRGNHEPSGSLENGDSADQGL